MADPNAAACRASSWVLLDMEAYIGRCNNGTTAMALTSTGISRCFVHGTGMAPGTWVSHACVLGAEGGILVLGVYFTSRTNPSLLMPRGEFFVYKSGNKQPPSLHRLPEPYPLHFRTNSVGIVLLDGGEDEYVLFSSRDNAWSVKVARADRGDGETDAGNLVVHEPSKVMAFGGGGTLAWIDLWQGVLTCNPLDPAAGAEAGQYGDEQSDGLRRDLPAADPGRDLRLQGRRRRRRPVCGDRVSQAGLRERRRRRHQQLLLDGHRVREVCFLRRAVDGDGSCLPCLLPEHEAGCGELNEQNWNKVVTAAPTLGLHDDGHILYMTSKLRGEDPRAWVLAFNTETKRLEALAEFSSERIFFFSPTYLPCVFSNYRSSEE